MKPRRIASVQLLGTIEHADDEPSFSPGISVLPTLDTPAEIGSPDILRAIFEIPPRRNRPEGYDAKDFDYDLKIGFPTGQARNVVRASYNDLFSRPLATKESSSRNAGTEQEMISKVVEGSIACADSLNLNNFSVKSVTMGATVFRAWERCDVMKGAMSSASASIFRECWDVLS